MLLLAILLQAAQPCTCTCQCKVVVPTEAIYQEAKKLWESRMESFGRTTCEREKVAVANWKAGTASLDAAMSYYDGEEVFLKIGNYKSDPYWKTCAEAVELAYRGNVPPAGTTLPNAKYGYVFGNNGSVTGYWNFTDGIKIDFDSTGDPESKQAILLLSQKAAYSPDSTPPSYTVSVNTSREASYTLRGYINAEKLGQPHRSRYDLLLNQILEPGGYIDQWVNGTYRTPASWATEHPTIGANQYYFQPFMAGLLLRALIQANDFRPDPRIPPAVKRLAQFVNEVAWIEEKDPDGVSKGYGSWWYEKWAPTLEDLKLKTQPAGAPDLNLLIAPALAWLYSQDKDPKWLEIGDKAFAGSKNAYLGQDKQFNQNYTWSFEYVKWREGN